jgi:hypothetical protein
VGKGGTGGDGDTAGTGSIEPGGNVKLSLFFDIWGRVVAECLRRNERRTVS